MTPPALIEFILDRERKPIYLVFQSKPNPPLAGEIANDGVFQPTRCPDDGILFLEGSPANYLDKTVVLSSGDPSLSTVLSSDHLQALNAAETCSFGEVGRVSGQGSGPGFTDDGRTFVHDECLGVSNDVVHLAVGRSGGFAVLIDRPNQYESRKYYDEEDAPRDGDAGGDEPENAEERGDSSGDVDMEERRGGNSQDDAERDDLASCVERLRLASD